MVSRGGKLLTVFASVFIGYTVALDAYLPYRVRTDELPKVLDIRSLLEAGHLHDFVYFAGQYHQIQTSILLRTTGMDVEALQILSPAIAGIFLSVIILVCFRIHKFSMGNPVWWGFAPGVVSIFVFAGFINRARETSHKSYIFLLFFISILLIMRLHLKRADWRTIAVLIVVGASIGMLNYFWGLILTPFIVGSALLGDAEVRRHVTAIAVLLYVFVIMLPFYNPLSRFPVGFVTSKISTLLAVRNVQVEANAGSKIARWPAIDLLGFTFSSWFVWWSGVIIIGLLSFLATVTVGFRYFQNRESVQPLGRMILGFNAVGSVVICTLLASGNLTIVRRIVPYIGILNMVYWGALYSATSSKWETPVFLSERRLTVLRMTLAVLVIVAGLGVPRSIDNGSAPPMESPIDHYIDEHEVARYEFIEHHGTNSDACQGIPSSEIPYQRVAQQVAGTKVRILSIDGHYDLVYNSGPRGSLLCRGKFV